MKTVAPSLLLAAAIAASLPATARETMVTKTTCMLTKPPAKPKKSPCTATQTGGAGVSVLTYTVGARAYDYIQDDNGTSFDGDSVQTYLRDKRFRITESDQKKAYFCYRTAKIELCSKQ